MADPLRIRMDRWSGLLLFGSEIDAELVSNGEAFNIKLSI